MKHSYMGYITSNIRYDKDLIFRDKILYCEITATIDGEHCKKNNAYFAKALDVSKQSISRSLTALRHKNYISIVIEKKANSNAVLNRFIYLTYPSIVGGVMPNNQNTPPSIVDGGKPVSADIVESGTKNGGTEKQPYYNNNITYIKSDKFSVADIALLPEINDNQAEYLKKIVFDFYAKKQKQLPKLNKDWDKNTSLINDAINTLYMIIKLDDYSENVVRDVLEWAINEKFWYTNLTSLRGLRKKSNNGQTKFTNIYLQYKNRR